MKTLLTAALVSTTLLGSALVVSAPAFSANDGAQLPQNVQACGLNIAARFVESAPRDRFIWENRSTPAWSITSITLQLKPSIGKLIFDTQDGGTGVEVFQPFREDTGSASLNRVTKLVDGGDEMTLDFHHFEAGEDYQFSLDVDDTLTDSDLGQIRVSASEMSGATVKLVLRGPGGVITNAAMQFGDDATASVTGGTCS